MEKQNMEELLNRYITGVVSEKERLLVAAWLKESPEHMKEYRTLHKLYDICLWQEKPFEEGQQTTNRKKTHLKPITIEILKIAAVLLVGFFSSHLFLTKEKETFNQTQTVHVPAGQRAELTLTDGTHIWLNSRSTLKFPQVFNEDYRNVELNGEGYFAVTKDSERPFIVKTQNYQIRVLGTEFNVKAYDNSNFFETDLVKGCVKVNSIYFKKDIILKPNESLVSTDKGIYKSSLQYYDYFNWRNGIFSFKNESLESLINKLNLYYDTSIEVKNKKLMKHHFSGKFRIQDGIEHVLKVLQLRHKFTYTKIEETNKIIIN